MAVGIGAFRAPFTSATEICDALAFPGEPSLEGFFRAVVAADFFAVFFAAAAGALEDFAAEVFRFALSC
jgi:hypothetical protein